MTKIPELTDRPRWTDNGRVAAFSNAMSAARAMWTTAERVAADGPSPVGHETRVEMFAIGEAVATVASEATSQAWTAYLWILEDLLSAAAGGDARLYEAAHAAAKVGEAAFISAARRDLTT